MENDATHYCGLLESIRHCTCLLRFLWMIEEDTPYEDAVEALELAIEHHNKLTAKGIDHPLITH